MSQQQLLSQSSQGSQDPRDKGSGEPTPVEILRQIEETEVEGVAIEQVDSNLEKLMKQGHALGTHKAAAPPHYFNTLMAVRKSFVERVRATEAKLQKALEEMEALNKAKEELTKSLEESEERGRSLQKDLVEATKAQPAPTTPKNGASLPHISSVTTATAEASMAAEASTGSAKESEASKKDEQPKEKDDKKVVDLTEKRKPYIRFAHPHPAYVHVKGHGRIQIRYLKPNGWESW